MRASIEWICRVRIQPCRKSRSEYRRTAKWRSWSDSFQEFPPISPADLVVSLETPVNSMGHGSPTWARTSDLRINSPSGHRPESRASQRSWPKQPVIFSPDFRIFRLGWMNSASRYYRTPPTNHSKPAMPATHTPHNRNPMLFGWTANAHDIFAEVIRANRDLRSKQSEALD